MTDRHARMSQHLGDDQHGQVLPRRLPTLTAGRAVTCGELALPSVHYSLFIADDGSTAMTISSSNMRVWSSLHRPEKLIMTS
jgi:hypothetical protein